MVWFNLLFLSFLLSVSNAAPFYSQVQTQNTQGGLTEPLIQPANTYDDSYGGGIIKGNYEPAPIDTYPTDTVVDIHPIDSTNNDVYPINDDRELYFHMPSPDLEMNDYLG